MPTPVALTVLMTNLEAYVNNDTLITLPQITSAQYPFNLAGYTPRLIVKANSLATDASGTTYTVGAGLTIVNSALGQMTFTLPHTAATTAGTFWWRMDVTDSSSNVMTAGYGNLYILAV